MSLVVPLVDVQEHFPADRPLTQAEAEATSSDLHWQLTTLMDQTEEVYQFLFSQLQCVY